MIKALRINSILYRPLSPLNTHARESQAKLRRMAASEATPNQSASDVEDPLVQYIVIRKDLWTELSWPLGSIIAQGCHASTAALWLSRDQPQTQQYCGTDNLDHMRKVVLETKNEAQLRSLSEKLTSANILHKLWIEQPEDYATCLATAPGPKSTLQPHVKKLKLCK